MRIVSARDGIIKIGEGSAIGPYTIINGGGNVMIGKTIFMKNISINANDHEHKRLMSIFDQGFIYENVIIEDDVWLGANVCNNKGVTVKKGSVIGANAVVTKDTDQYSINVGVPSKNFRKEIDLKRITYCKNCVMPSTKPYIKFNIDGVCNACVSGTKKII